MCVYVFGYRHNSVEVLSKNHSFNSTFGDNGQTGLRICRLLLTLHIYKSEQSTETQGPEKLPEYINQDRKHESPRFSHFLHPLAQNRNFVNPTPQETTSRTQPACY
jgi:hypothetical protein